MRAARSQPSFLRLQAGSLIWSLGGGALAGWWLGDVWLGLFLATLGLLAWHLRQLKRLHDWLRIGKRYTLPESTGLWGDIFNQIHFLQQRNRKRKKRLRELLNRFHEATEAMPDATVLLTGDEDIEWWNPAASALLGLSYPRDVGQRISNLVRHPALHHYLQEGDFAGSVQFPNPDRPEVVLAVQIVTYAKSRRLLVARDVTQMQRIERMRRDFVANVSHELRTPLTVVTGYLESMAEDDELPRVWQRSVDSMCDQATRMRRLVEELLLLARLETDNGVHSAPVDVPTLLGEITDEARALSGDQDHRIDLQALPGLWLLGAEAELRSLFSNLVFNAVRYTPEGGKVQIRWWIEQDRPCFEVIDNGIGIAPEHLPRLTERFYRVDVARSRGAGGTGLGLAIVKHVLLRHQGELEIESSLGEGSRFLCRFAAARAHHRPPPALPAAPQASQARG